MLLELKQHHATSVQHIGGAVVRLTDANKIIRSQVPVEFDFMAGRHVDLLRDFQENSLFIVDPSMELTWPSTANIAVIQKLTWNESLVTFANLCVREGLISSKEEDSQRKAREYEALWDDLSSNADQREVLLRRTLESQFALKADVLLPPVPLITSKLMLDFSLKINDYSAEYARKIFGKECPLMFVVKESLLGDKSFMNKLESAILDYSTSLIVIKFKGLDFFKDHSNALATKYGSLLNDISMAIREKPRALMLLESGDASFLSLCLGADIVSSSVGGVEYTGKVRRTPSKGSWLDPEAFYRIKFSELVRRYGASGLPCACPWCRGSKDFLHLRNSDWNRVRKFHYLWLMNKYTEQVSAEVMRGRLTKTRDKLMSSSLSKYATMIDA